MDSHVLKIIPTNILKGLSKQDLVTLLEGEQSLRQQMQVALDRIAREKKILEEEIYDIGGKYIKLKSFVFDRSSEKSAKESKAQTEEKAQTEDPVKADAGGKKERPSGRKNKSLKERYPNLPVVEQTVEFASPPNCSCCQSSMLFSGMTEDSEFLDVEPRKYRIVCRRRQKFRCTNCHGEIKTAPNLRIKVTIQVFMHLHAFSRRCAAH